MTNPLDPFADPTKTTGVVRPKPRDLVGRVLIVQPTKIEYGVPSPGEPGKTQTRITADVVVCDGGPILFGGNPARNQPNTHQVATPHLVKGMYISSEQLVEALAEHVGKSIVLGKIRMGQSSNPTFSPPFIFDPIEAGSPDRALAGQVWQAKNTGGFVNPEPHPIGAAPAPVAVQSSPNPSAMASHVAGQTGNPQVAAAAAPMTPAQFLAQQQAAAAPAPTSNRPADWPEEMWKGLTDEQRGQVLGTNQPTPF